MCWPPAFTPRFATGQQTDSYRAVDRRKNKISSAVDIFFSSCFKCQVMEYICMYVIFRSIITYSSRAYLNIDERNDDGTIPREERLAFKKNEGGL